ncbi:propanediol utilization: polyhedral bodies pduT [Anaerocolumna cellulosilytica]|uniref:Propanediol utilization: polyhedral bodies pduT n=1 Tax=Anaerocolumna cellulosilytica TaxID=433286 RepID=A0A6S6R5B7_9FIRM|nr:BMC domain-containing protein [Anaerocolumna cellulosilytica]MBB5194178.1 microcompartment protein CcmL/EutN [Anaerocolumna cellulosilytica]BCJ94610.1 propanediol utilization: polyhedral bodies pduT [Anaerocolumna cellulosilytica]
MNKAIGMVEYKTVSTGIFVADLMVKTAQVEIMEAQTVCPGKYIVLLQGDLSAVNACIELARTGYSEHLIDSFILGNPHDSIFTAIYGTTNVEKLNALGILETFSAASIIVAADEAAKTAQVELIELRIARGMCGKSYLLLTGDIASVEAAIDKAKKAVADGAMLLDSSIIANPDSKLCKSIL